jgi:hypothetical protein
MSMPRFEPKSLGQKMDGLANSAMPPLSFFVITELSVIEPVLESFSPCVGQLYIITFNSSLQKKPKKNQK